MRRFILLLLVLVISVWLGLQLAKDTGIAFFSYRQWSVEMPLWFAILALILLLSFCYFIWYFLSGIDNFFYRCGNWWRWRRKKQSYSKTNRGLIELMEERWKKAENYLTAGIAQSDAPLINYLALAEAAHEQAAYDRQEKYLHRAQTITADAEVVVGLTQAKFQIDQGQFEQALATLHHVQTIAPRHALMLKLLERVYVHLGEWHNVLKLLSSLYKAKVITSEQLTLLEQKTYAELLKASVNHPEGAASLRAIWQSMPRRLQKDPKLLGCYAQQLLFYPDGTTEAVELLNKSLKKSWDPELVRLYGLLNTGDPVQQLVQAERWLMRYPDQPLLLLTLGRLSMRCQLWGKARSYFEESLKMQESAAAYLEYGRLLDQLGETSTVYRDGLVFLINKAGEGASRS